MGNRYILMKMMMASLVTRDVVKEFAGLRYGFLAVDRRTHTNAFQSSTAYVCSSYPKLTKSHRKSLHRREQASKRCLNEPSGVRYTDGHYTCSTADIRELRAAGYDRSSSRQTIRCQRRAVQCRDSTTARRQTSRTSAFSRRRPLPASFEAASANLHIISGGSSSTRRRRC